MVGASYQSSVSRKGTGMKIQVGKSAGGVRDILIIPRRGQGKPPVMVRGVAKKDIRATVEALMDGARDRAIEP